MIFRILFFDQREVYVIGKEIWVVGRPSLPNLTKFSAKSVRDFAKRIDGTVVPLKDSPAKGYVVFLSTKMPLNNVSSQ